MRQPTIGSLEQILPHGRRFHGPVELVEAAALVVRLIAEGLMEEMQHQAVGALPRAAQRGR